VKARSLIAACLVVSVAPASASECIQNNAIYTEKNNGYVLTFRKPDPWEGAANMLAVLDLAFPNGQKAWGWIYVPNGTSHDRADFFTVDCSLPELPPGADDPTEGSSHEELEACRIYEGIALALENDDISGLLWHDGAPPAKTLLFPNLGPTIRYSGLVLSPGEEPHEVFTLKGCTP
jgi:hypothetical protein